MTVALVPDVKGWAWWAMATDLAAAYPGEYAVCEQLNFAEWWQREGSRTCRGVLFYSWASAPLPGTFGSRVPTGIFVTSEGVLYDELKEDDWNTRIVTRSRNRGRARERLPKFDFVLAANLRLADGCRGLNPRTHLTMIGVNSELFCPGPRPERQGRLRVGWCANRKGIRSVKGYDEILVPLMRTTGDRYEWVVNDRDHRTALTRLEMRDWYRGLDVFLCTSINEGSPNTVFEAAACGVPVVSTNVGMVRGWRLLHALRLAVPPYHNATTAAETVHTFQARIEGVGRMDHALTRDSFRKDAVRNYSWDVLAPLWHYAIQSEVNR